MHGQYFRWFGGHSWRRGVECGHDGCGNYDDNRRDEYGKYEWCIWADTDYCGGKYGRDCDGCESGTAKEEDEVEAMATVDGVGAVGSVIGVVKKYIVMRNLSVVFRPLSNARCFGVVSGHNK